MGKVTQVKLESGAADGAGDATSTKDKVYRGRLLSVYVDYSAGSNANTDVTLETSHGSGDDQLLLSLTNNNSSGWYYPRDFAHDSDGNVITTDGTIKVPVKIEIFGLPKITVADNNVGETVNAWLYIEEY